MLRKDPKLDIIVSHPIYHEDEEGDSSSFIIITVKTKKSHYCSVIATRSQFF